MCVLSISKHVCVDCRHSGGGLISALSFIIENLPLRLFLVYLLV